ncbi:MAG TPA: hypothetical protein VMV05_02110 [bacterium]|nr:hypothetical protein [bacterium]
MPNIHEEVTNPARTSLRLFRVGDFLERILRSWGAKQIHRLGRELTGTLYLPMERMALLTGTLRGFLVLRGSLEFSAWLRQLHDETPLGRCSEAEVFEELVALLGLSLTHSFWNPDSFEVGPIHPFVSIPSDWPSGEPQFSCSMLVEEHPVEMRLWLESAAGEGD